jgi:quercetin dioxygenase-like cupin family protein
MSSMSGKYKVMAGAFAGFVAGCAAGAVSQECANMLPDRPPGSNEILRADLESADGVEVIISDVVIPPNAGVPKHYHPGEEFVYVIAGSAVHVGDGRADQKFAAGDAFVIRKKKPHAPHAGEEGARAIVFRVHTVGAPERILVEE